MNFIIETMDEDLVIIKYLQFLEKYYDGWEHSISTTSNSILTTRWYYYGVPKDLIEKALRVADKLDLHCHILPNGVGNIPYNF